MSNLNLTLSLLAIVDAVLFHDSVNEASLNQTWGDLDPTATDMHCIASKFKTSFGVTVEQSDWTMFGYDVTLAEVCEQLALRMGVPA